MYLFQRSVRCFREANVVLSFELNFVLDLYPEAVCGRVFLVSESNDFTIQWGIVLNLSVKHGRKADVVRENLRGNMWITNDNQTNGVKHNARLSDPHHTTTIFFISLGST